MFVLSVATGLSAGTWRLGSARSLAIMLAAGQVMIAILVAISGIGLIEEAEDQTEAVLQLLIGVGAILLNAAVQVDLERVRAGEAGTTTHVGDLARLRQLPETPGHLGHDGILEGAQSVQIDHRLAERDPPLGGLFRLVEQLGHVQQRF